MSTIRRALAGLSELADSPTLGRDLGTLLSPWRTALWFLVLNGVIGVTLVILFASSGNDGLSRSCEALGMGQYFACLLLAALGGVCTVLIPLRACGHFLGPRWGRYFDQIVMTGINPVRYVAGKVIAQNLFFAGLAAGAIPYLVLCLSLGGTSPLHLLVALLALWVYANVLTLAMVAASVHIGELVGLPLVIIFFGTWYILGLCPLHPITGTSTPSYVLLAPIHALPAAEVESHLVPPVAWTLAGGLLWFLPGSALILLWMTCLVIHGPTQNQGPAARNFGEVVLPGDARRKGWVRLRLYLRRVSEMAFFYENRPHWVTRWELLLTYGPFLLCLLGGMAGGLGLLHLSAGELDEEDFHIVNVVVLTLWVLLISASLCNARGAECSFRHLGRLRWCVGTVDTVLWALLAGGYTALAVGLPLLRELFSDTTWYQRANGGVWSLRGLAIGALLLLLGLELHALLRWLTMCFWDVAAGVALAFTVFFGFLVLMPLLVGVMVHGLHDVAVLGILEPVAAWFSLLSPIPLIWYIGNESINSPIRNALDEGGFLLTIAFHLALAALFVVMAVKRHRHLRREATP